jgi:hypothetical protein
MTGPRRPPPRRPQRGARSLAQDRHTLMVRRSVAGAIGLLLLIVIALVVNGCVKSEQQQALRDYNRNVSQLASESDEQVARPLFSALTNAAAKSALNVEEQIDQLRVNAQDIAARARKLKVPGAMSAAQRDLLLALDLRVEGLSKLTQHVPTALGGKEKQATAKIAGDMETFLASDVLYSQRVAPLIQQELAAGGVHGLTTTPTRFLPNIGWLEPNTAASRITGKSISSIERGFTPGDHGHALRGVGVGKNTLEAEPGLNHIHGGANPTFSVMVEDSGESPETNVKVDVTVSAAGKQLKASHVIEKTEPGKTVNVDIPISGVQLGVAAKIEVSIEKVPGENDVENNKGTYLAIFEQ